MKTSEDWNKAGFFSGITEDYSNYHWYKGEKENPYTKDTFHPLAASFGNMSVISTSGILIRLTHKKASQKPTMSGKGTYQ